MDEAAEVPFVGRQNELGVLQQALADAGCGDPRLVLVEGEAGIGKTALMRTFLDRNPGVRHVWVSGDETEVALRFGVVDQLRAAIPSSPRDREVPATSPDSFVIGAELLEMLGSLQDDGPLVVVVDDLHWADQDSSRALLFWLRRLRQDHVLVLCAARPHVSDVLGDSWARLIADNARSRRVRVSGLNAAEVGVLAQRDGEALPAAAAERLRSHTAGNPLYVAGLLAELPAESLRDPTGSLPAPHSYAATVLARTARLSADARELISAAAVLGVRAPLAHAVATSGLRDADSALDEAVAQQLLSAGVRAGIKEVGFAHPLVRAAVYDDLSPTRRRALHLAAARVLAPTAGLAHRVAASDGLDTALADELADSADLELDAGAVKDAAEHLFWSAGLEPDQTRAQTRLLRGVELLMVSGDLAGTQARASSVERLPDSDHKRYALAAIAASVGDLTAARAQFRVLATPEVARDEPILFSRITAGLACVAAVLGAADEAIEHARASLEIAGAPPTSRSVALQALAFGLAESGRIPDGLALLADVSHTARAPGAFEAELLMTRGMLRVWNGENAAAADDLRTVVRWAKLGYPLTSVPIAYTYLGEAEFGAGGWDDAITHAELAASLGHDLEHPWYLAQSHSLAARIYIRTGESEFAAAHADSARAAVRAAPHPIAEAHACVAAASVAAGLGEWDAALVALAPLRGELGDPVSDHPALTSWLLLEAEADLATGRVARAAGALDRLAARPAGTAQAGTEHRRLRARVLQASGDPAAALATLASGIDRADGTFASARLQLDHGRALLRAGARDDARAPLRTARRTAERLNARPLLDECDTALAECGVAEGPAADRPFGGLTNREQVVARLVTRGLTNREIAAELFVSAKTIEYHLGNIFAKLGISTRRELWRMRSAGDPLPARA